MKRVPSEAEEVRPARCCRGVALESRNSAIAVGAARGTRGTPRSPADSRTRFGAGRAWRGQSGSRASEAGHRQGRARGGGGGSSLKVPKERISSSSRSACDLGSGARPTRASERNWMATGTVGLGGACGGGGAWREDEEGAAGGRGGGRGKGGEGARVRGEQRERQEGRAEASRVLRLLARPERAEAARRAAEGGHLRVGAADHSIKRGGQRRPAGGRARLCGKSVGRCISTSRRLLCCPFPLLAPSPSPSPSPSCRLLCEPPRRAGRGVARARLAAGPAAGGRRTGRRGGGGAGRGEVELARHGELGRRAGGRLRARVGQHGGQLPPPLLGAGLVRGAGAGEGVEEEVLGEGAGSAASRLHLASSPPPPPSGYPLALISFISRRAARSSSSSDVAGSSPHTSTAPA